MNKLFKLQKNTTSIFKLIDDYKKENNQTLIKYIKKHPKSLYDVNNDGDSVYSYATLKNINCLIDIHESYLSLQSKKDVRKFFKEPCEVENLKTKNTAIFYTIEKNLLSQLDYLINIVKVNINHQNINGDTPLHIACKFGNRKIVDILLESNFIKLDVLNNELSSPLHIAAIRKYNKITELLLNKGASFKIIKRGKRKNYELDVYSHILSKQNEYPEIMKLFIKFKKIRKNKEKLNQLKKEYKYICESLENNIDTTLIKTFANTLGISSIKNLSKKNLCKKMAQRLVIYAQNPDIIAEIKDEIN